MDLSDALLEYQPVNSKVSKTHVENVLQLSAMCNDLICLNLKKNSTGGV
jgi:hypothetical protein